MVLMATAVVGVHSQVASNSTDVDVAALKALGYTVLQGVDYLPGPYKLLKIEVCPLYMLAVYHSFMACCRTNAPWVAPCLVLYLDTRIVHLESQSIQ